MQVVFVNIIAISLLLFLIIGVDGKIKFTPGSLPPSILGWGDCVKYTDIVTGAVRWRAPYGNTVAVSISAGANGLGEGLGTLKDVTIYHLDSISWNFQDKTSIPFS